MAVILIVAIAEAEHEVVYRKVEELAFKDCVPFPIQRNCITIIQITQIRKTRNLDLLTSMYNLLMFSDN